ncbi:MAG TPA: phosphate ABC transporter substrate-binding/OmpA family protein [Candidatus Methylacidiphilales bacterium]|nr:phosphate ABC transporter substrate-binding/OmpA family protein [Candidatus Methylacidiphilales bacterium]
MTKFGKAFFTLLLLGLIGFGVYTRLSKAPVTADHKNKPGTTQVSQPGPSDGGSEDLSKLPEAMDGVPQIGASAPFVPQDNILLIELSTYAGYSGIIAANGGLEPNPNSLFAKYGFKVKLSLTEEESWPALNSGKLAASATTVDVLAAYGKQFNVVVPLQIGFSRGADGLIVNRNIKSINALAGKTVITSQFTEADFFLRYLAQEAGLSVAIRPSFAAKPDPERINVIYHENAGMAGELFLKLLTANDQQLAGTVTWAPTTTAVVDGSNGKAFQLVSNRNLLIIADILIVNRGFAEANPKMVAGLVEGILEGNRMVRENPEPHIAVLAKAFKWDAAQTRAELAKVHLSNLPENEAFFSGAINAAGSYGSIYYSATTAYGPELIKNPADSDRFLSLDTLKNLKKEGKFADQKISIEPLRSPSAGGTVEDNPLLSRNIRFLFLPNDDKLDMAKPTNIKDLDAIKQMLQTSPGSTVLLRGHVDNAQIPAFRKSGGEELVKRKAMDAFDLSKRRAAEIKRILIEKYQISDKRIDTIGRGWEEPAGTESDQNRRVEVQWFTLE